MKFGSIKIIYSMIILKIKDNIVNLIKLIINVEWD
jgi:hypothetical protein